jgi:hypothetical protein
MLKSGKSKVKTPGARWVSMFLAITMMDIMSCKMTFTPARNVTGFGGN